MKQAPAHRGFLIQNTLQSVLLFVDKGEPAKRLWSVLQCCEGRATGNATDVRMDDSAETVRTSKLAQPSKINRSSRSANSANSAKELCSRRRCE